MTEKNEKNVQRLQTNQEKAHHLRKKNVEEMLFAREFAYEQIICRARCLHQRSRLRCVGDAAQRISCTDRTITRETITQEYGNDRGEEQHPTVRLYLLSPSKTF